MKTTVATIPVGSIENLFKEVRSLQRHAQRLGVAEPSMRVLSETQRELHQTLETIHRTEDGLLPADQRGYAVEVVDVEITTPEIGASSGKYRSVAALQHIGRSDTGERMVEVFAHNVADQKAAEPYRRENFCCDHCKTTRKRFWSIIVEEVQSKKLLQLGSECAVYFIDDPEKEILKLQFQSHLIQLIRMFEEEGTTKDFRAHDRIVVADAVNVAAASIAAVRQHGWVSRWDSKNARPNPNCTGDQVAIATGLLPKRNRDDVVSRVEITDEDRKQAKDALDWIQSVDGSDEFLESLKLLYAPGWISSKRVFHAASLSVAWQKEIERRIQKPSNFVGKEKERGNFEVRVVGSLPFQSQYGVTILYSLRDREGNDLIWRSSSGGFPNHDNSVSVANKPKEHWFLVKATVKSHSEYKGRKQTELTRVSIVRDFTQEIVDKAMAAEKADVEQILALPDEQIVAHLSQPNPPEALVHRYLYEQQATAAGMRAVAANPTVDPLILMDLVDNDESLAPIVAANSGLSPTSFTHLLRYRRNPEVLLAMARNPSTPGGLLEELYYPFRRGGPKDGLDLETISAAILQNPRVRSGEYSKVLATLSYSGSPIIRDKILEILESFDFENMDAAGQLPVTTKEHLLLLKTRLSQDRVVPKADDLEKRLERVMSAKDVGSLEIIPEPRQMGVHQPELPGL